MLSRSEGSHDVDHDVPRSSSDATVPFVVLDDESHWATAIAPGDPSIAVSVGPGLTGWIRKSRRDSLRPSSTTRQRGAKSPLAVSVSAPERWTPYRFIERISSNVKWPYRAASHAGLAKRHLKGARAATPSRCLFENGHWSCTGDRCQHATNANEASGLGDATSSHTPQRTTSRHQGLLWWSIGRVR